MSAAPKDTLAGQWIEWSGGENPAGDQVVETRHASGDECTGSEAWPASFWVSTFWDHSTNDPYRIIAYRLAAHPASVSPGTDEPSGEGVRQPSLNHEELVTALEGLARDATAMGWPDDADDLSAAVDVIRQQSAALARKDAALRRAADDLTQASEVHFAMEHYNAARVLSAQAKEARQALETKDGEKA